MPPKTLLDVLSNAERLGKQLPRDFWYSDKTLRDLGGYRTDLAAWGYIASTAKSMGADAWLLERTVDEYLRRGEGKFYVVPLALIPEEQLTWLWEPYIPRRKLTIVDGDPGLGKTYLMLAMAAAVTRGYAMPDQEGRPGVPDPSRVANVLYITAEDGLGDTIRPRAQKVGADLDRLYVAVSNLEHPSIPHPFSLRDSERLDSAIQDISPALVILDPLQAFLGGDTDSNSMTAVRPLTTILALLAEKHNTAIVAIRHWNKALGGKARYRGAGSIDFNAAARSVLSIGESHEDERLRILAHTKHNNTARGMSQVFRLGEEGLEWCGTSEYTSDDLSNGTGKAKARVRVEAGAWLSAYLKEGPQLQQDVEVAAEGVGISPRTLRRAREEGGILSSKDRTSGRYYWRLPKFEPWDRRQDIGTTEEEDDEAPF